GVVLDHRDERGPGRGAERRLVLADRRQRDDRCELGVVEADDRELPTRLCERLQRAERDVVRGREDGGRRLRQREERAQLGVAARGVEVALADVLGGQRQSACGQLLLVAAQAV